MAHLNLNTHKREKNPKYGFEESVPVAPYVRFSYSDSPPIYLQNGTFFSEESGSIEEEDVPGWVWDQLAKTNPEVLKECGYTPPVQKK